MFSFLTYFSFLTIKFGEKVVLKIHPPEPIHSDGCTGVTGSLKFDENV